MAIRFDLDGHVATITIDRYKARNAIDPEHAGALTDAWLRVRDDDAIRVAVITGVHDAFCSGGDLKTLVGPIVERLGGGAEWSEADNAGRPSFTLRTLNIFKPIVAAVNGCCIAGGMELLGGTDIRIASTEATFAVAEPRHGLIASRGTTSRLPRQLGWPAAMEILLTARTFSAERALALGLLNEVCEPGELLDRAQDWAGQIARNAPLAVQGTKRSALLGWSAGSLDEALRIEDGVFREVFATEDAREGVRAFREKRRPEWMGR
jgi:enoyl-CoA hydratase